MRPAFFTTALLLCLPVFLHAQKVETHGGMTLGITTPGPTGWMDHRMAPAYPDPTAKTRSLPSAVAGADVAITFWKHLAVDAGLRGSETGYTHEHSGRVDARTAYQYKERMRFRQLSLPITVGYAFRINKLRLRLGAGYALTYFVSGEYQSELRYDESLNGSWVAGRKIDLFGDDDYYTLDATGRRNNWGRRQAQFRIAASMQTVARWKFGVAAHSGQNMNLYSTERSASQPGTENYVPFASMAYELCATYNFW